MERVRWLTQTGQSGRAPVFSPVGPRSSPPLLLGTQTCGPGGSLETLHTATILPPSHISHISPPI